MERERERGGGGQADRHIERETGRQTDRDTERHREKQTDRQTQQREPTVRLAGVALNNQDRLHKPVHSVSVATQLPPNLLVCFSPTERHTQRDRDRQTDRQTDSLQFASDLLCSKAK